MALDEFITDLSDDYVANLLIKEAKDGRSVSRPQNLPTVNKTAFENILTRTHNHNKALLAKETSRSQVLLGSLPDDERRERRAQQIGGGDIRARQLGKIANILGERKRDAKPKTLLKYEDERSSKRIKRSVDENSGHKNSSREEKEGARSQRSRHRSHKYLNDDEEEDREVDSQKNGHRSHRGRNDLEGEDQDSNSRKKRHRTHRSREEEIDEDEGLGTLKNRYRSYISRDDQNEDKEEGSSSHKSRHRGHRSGSRDKDRYEEVRRKRHRSRSPKESRDSAHSHKSKRKRSKSPARDQERTTTSHQIFLTGRESSKDEKKATKRRKPDYDSDPLEDIIGPQPAKVEEVRTRGRGTISRESGIDSRFAADYDPTADVQFDLEDDDDWGQSLEAVRARAAWKQQGADRLRAAGFTEENIRKWEKGDEKVEDVVQWKKKGEGREWDRGKVFDEEGHVTVEPTFGRLI